jgi:acyl-CoA reductase-like NAD-dependent aldehyde dehydrogenase
VTAVTPIAPTPADRRLGEACPFIDGEWVRSTTDGETPKIDPFTGAQTGVVHLGGVDEIDRAVAIAQAAWPAWRDLAPDHRRDILLRVADLIDVEAASLAATATTELGTTLNVSQAGAATASSWFRYYAGWADKLEGATVPVFPVDGFDYTLPEPYGVVGVIITWNGPLYSIGMKVAPALAAGNCVVLKSPELTPFAAARFADLAIDAGLPAGVLHVIPGGPAAGDRLVRHPDVAKISFTGGPATAAAISHAAADLLKPLTMELGGKSANLVFPDADLDTAIPFSVALPFMGAGQGCTHPTRLIVHSDIYDEVVARAQAVLEHMPLGDPLLADTAIGPVITEAAANRVVAMVRQGVDEGGRLIMGGERAAGDLANGFFVRPAIVADVPPDGYLAQNEVFGPVLAIMKFSTEDDAVRIANATRYGLAAYVQTSDVKRATRLARSLRAGAVNVNGFFGLAASAPFGGYQASGYGREGGRAGIEEFLQIKNVFLGS